MADETTPRQTQQTSLQFRAWLFGAWRYENLSGIVVGAVLALLYFILAGYVPAAYVQDSYRPYGALYVKLYPHVFLYPQFYGWLSILLLIPPVLYLKAHPDFARKKRGLLGMLAVVLVLSVMVLTIALWSSNVAPFGLKPELIEGEPALREHFNKESPSEAERDYYQKRACSISQASCRRRMSSSRGSENSRAMVTAGVGLSPAAVSVAMFSVLTRRSIGGQRVID